MALRSRPRKVRKVARKARARKPVAKLSRPMRSAIQKVVAGDLETKYRAQTLRVPDSSSILTSFTGFTSGITGVGEIYSLLPGLNQGSDSFNRVGDAIQPLGLKVHLNIVSSEVFVKSYDQTVFVFILECVSVKSLENWSAIPINELLNDGNGNNVQFDGTSQTSLYAINKKLFRVHHVIRKRIVSNVGTPPNLANGVSQDHSMRHHNVTASVPVPKKLMYSSDTDAYPVNFAPFMVIGFIDNTLNGDTAPGATIGVQVEGRSELWYKDA